MQIPQILSYYTRLLKTDNFELQTNISILFITVMKSVGVIVI